MGSLDTVKLTPLKYLTLAPRTAHTATVIFVHGLGDTGDGVMPIVDHFTPNPVHSHIKWILPHSPSRPVRANMNLEMPSWYDIYSFGLDADEDEEGMIHSSRLLSALIEDEVARGTDPSRIVLGGFSQGGTVSILTGLTTDVKIGGIVVLSGWLPIRHRIKSLASPHAASIPIFWGQGTNDSLVKPSNWKPSVDLLHELGMSDAGADSDGTLDFRQYTGMGHLAGGDELQDLGRWLSNVIGQ